MQVLLRICSLVAAMLLSVAMQAQSVGLVLSGGGAKGLSHIGVIKALEENNIPIDYICGTSMGSIVGGLYAIGVTPDEMMYLFSSPEFQTWYKGKPEKGYEYPLFRPDPKPKFVTLTFSKTGKNGKKTPSWKVNLPTSIVSPYSMDLAVNQIFASANAAAGNSFDSLMIPFFCVSADIVKKKEYIARSGDLGSAVRASMTYPFYFKPIVIDSTLMFDGGFYNNFPWEEMKKSYSPDVIIGSKCVRGERKIPQDDDIIAQIETMLMTDTDYGLPEEDGILIQGVYDFGLMDFDKLKEISDLGYQTALKYIPEIKKRIKREVSDEELAEKRLAFRKKWNPLMFDSIEINGNLSPGQKELLSNMFTGGKPDDFTFEKFKQGYYYIVALDGLRTVYPTARKNGEDGKFLMNVRVSENAPIKLYIGGNISSSALNQGYIGMSYSKFAKTFWNLDADLHIGKFYSGIAATFKHNFSLKPLAFYEMQAVAHKYSYVNPMSNFFVSPNISTSMQESDLFLSGSIATPFLYNRSILAKMNFTWGYTYYSYYSKDAYSAYDRPDRTAMSYVSPSLKLERNTVDYIMFPTSGKRQSVSLRYIYGQMTNVPGTTTDNLLTNSGSVLHDLRFRLNSETYYPLADWFSLGVYADLVLGPEIDFGSYRSSSLYRTQYSPFPYSQHIFHPEYRASSYIGVSLNPVFKITSTIMVHGSAGYFQPYKLLVERSYGTYTYTSPLPRGGFIGNVAFVWQSPIGPVSLSSSYHERSAVKWGVQFNIGVILFKNRFLNS